MEDGEQITVLIHGTFANEPPEEGRPPQPRWWRVTEAGLTAERLRSSLRTIGPDLEETIWEPGRDARDEDMTYEDLVEWSSANRHRDRVGAARKLATSLESLADRRGCTPANPLRVNYVAHSHGGNVVLESLKHITPDGNVAPRQVALLGTPLTWRRTDPRIGYLAILFAFFIAWVAFEIDYLFRGGRTTDPDAFGSLAADIVFSLVLLTALFWIAFLVIRLLRLISDSQTGTPAYGPRPDELKATLGGRPVVLFISDEDEADLMLQLGAAPLDTYRALVRGQPTLRGVSLAQKAIRLPIRLIEVVFVRPFTYAILIPLLEILLERFGLGFPLRSVMVRNFEMTTWTRSDPYESAIVKVSIEADELTGAQAESDRRARRLLRLSQSPERASIRESDKDRIHELRETLLETITGLRQQIHLSHSGYYQAPKIIDQVARVIAAPDDEVERVIESLDVIDLRATEAGAESGETATSAMP